LVTAYLVGLIAVDALLTAYSAGVRQRNYAPADLRVLGLFLIIMLLLPATYVFAIPATIVVAVVRSRLTTAVRRYSAAIAFAVLLAGLFVFGFSRVGTYERIIFP
jgi:hypothetical protein